MRAKDERRYIRKETHLPPHTFSIPMKKKTHHDVMSFLEYKYEKKKENKLTASTGGGGEPSGRKGVTQAAHWQPSNANHPTHRFQIPSTRLLFPDPVEGLLQSRNHPTNPPS